jgi:hypothetical protein
MAHVHNMYEASMALQLPKYIGSVEKVIQIIKFIA